MYDHDSVIDKNALLKYTNVFYHIQGDPESDTDNENKLREESSLDEERRTIGRPQVSNGAEAA